MTFRTWLTTACLLTTAVGCGGSAAAPAESSSDVTIAQSDVARVPAADVNASDLQSAVMANNAFAVDLYAQALREDPSKNVLTSPISATLALTMTYAGAQGQTKTEMQSALHLGPADDAVFAGQNALSQALNERGAAALKEAQRNASESGQAAPSESDYQLQVVNSVWGEQTYHWEKPFLDTLAANYGTGVYQRDFVHAYEPARVAINAWVSEQTSDKINDLLPEDVLDDATRMVLVNAIHLKLPWATKFEASATAAGNFTREAGTVSADFMQRTASLGYVDDGKAQIVALPLSHGDLSVVIALPHEGVTLSEYEAGLAGSSAPLVVPSSYALVDLKLPKARFTSRSVSLAEALKTLGMQQAFDPSLANFKGLCENTPDHQNLYISEVLQKSMIAMQETGVEAAAATAVLTRAGSSANPNQDDSPEPIPMLVDHPYLVSVIDQTTGAILMLGHIQDPTDAGTP